MVICITGVPARTGDFVIGISDWYSTLGELSFPTVFLRLDAAERRALIEADDAAPASRRLGKRLQSALRSLFGSGVVGTDVCAPTDSPSFRYGRRLRFGRTSWRLLAASEKVRGVLAAGETDCLIVRPYRRMDRAREFRMFVYRGQFAGLSQYHLDRYLPGIEKRQREILTKARKLVERIAPRLPAESVAVDVYLTSDGEFMLVDINDWGGDTSPLLMRTWEHDWANEDRLALVPEPVNMKGDISVSF